MRLRSVDYSGPLAQLVEQGTLNPKVAGSIPARPIHEGAGSSAFSLEGRRDSCEGGNRRGNMPLIETPYVLGDANEPIALYRGAGTLRRSDGDAVEGPTTLDFRWLPRPRLAFELQEAPSHATSDEPLAYTLSLDEIDDSAPVSVQVLRVRRGTYTETTGIADAIHGQPLTVDRMVFLIPNWPSVLGEWIDAPDGSGGWRGRVTLEGSGWRVVLESRRDIGTLIENLRASGGWAATHLGSLERGDGASFRAADGRSFLDCVGLFLAFARGLWTPPTLTVGFEKGRLVWREWAAPTTSAWRGNFSWFWEQRPEMLSGVFPGFVDRWEDPKWRESLLLAVSWLVEANPSDPAERSIVVAQVALELMGWLTLVRDTGVMTPKDWKQGRDRALRHLRRLIGHLGISPAIPSDFTNLANLARIEGWADGAEALVGFRNRLVHPRDRASSILSTAVMARVELAELSSWYCELSLLHFCGYQGEYLNRSTLDIEQVPWV